jgi:hypothetical protein
MRFKIICFFRDLTSNRKHARTMLRQKVDLFLHGADSKLGRKQERERRRKYNAARYEGSAKDILVLEHVIIYYLMILDAPRKNMGTRLLSASSRLVVMIRSNARALRPTAMSLIARAMVTSPEKSAQRADQMVRDPPPHPLQSCS